MVNIFFWCAVCLLFEALLLFSWSSKLVRILFCILIASQGALVIGKLIIRFIITFHFIFQFTLVLIWVWYTFIIIHQVCFSAIPWNCTSVKAGEVSATPDPDLDTFLALWRFFLYRFFKFSNIFDAATKNKNSGYSKESIK